MEIERINSTQFNSLYKYASTFVKMQSDWSQDQVPHCREFKYKVTKVTHTF